MDHGIEQKNLDILLVFVKLDDDGNYLYQEDFITGWLSNESAWGRPVSPYIMNDGSMLLSDDKYNVIYRWLDGISKFKLK